MNNITLSGRLNNVQYSHNIGSVEYNKADLLVPKIDGTEDIISIRFKKFCNKYKDDDIISICGNIRSYSQKVDENTNKVEIYVFTYFDEPTVPENNKLVLDGRICKIDTLRYSQSNRPNLHFILANNIITATGDKKINNYIPCTVWDDLALQMKDLQVSDKIEITGQLHSRVYKKTLPNGDVQAHMAHEVVVDNFTNIE